MVLGSIEIVFLDFVACKKMYTVYKQMDMNIYALVGFLAQLSHLQCTLLVLIDFCPVFSELFTWSSVTKTFDILPEIIIEYQI